MKAIKSNIQGSAPYYYLYFLHKFKTVGVSRLSEEEQTDLDKFTKSEKFRENLSHFIFLLLHVCAENWFG